MKQLHTLLLIASLLVGLTISQGMHTLYGQTQPEITHELQLIARQGATDIAFQFLAPEGSIVVIDWGDGDPVSIVSRYNDPDSYLSNEAKHTYAAPLAALHKIVVEAKDLTAISSSYSDKGIVGFGQIDAPELRSLKFGYGCSLKESLDGVVDLTNCPKLTDIELCNITGLRLPAGAPLETLRISSDWKKTSERYARMTMDKLDLTPYASTLNLVNIQKQEVREVDITGCTLLKAVELYWTEMYHLKGIRDARQATRIGVSQNYLGLDELPIKYDGVEYEMFLYSQQDYPVKDKVRGFSIDLSNIKRVADAHGVEHQTSFRWFKVVGENPEEVSADLVSEEDGVFTFSEGILAAGEERATLYVEIENDLFPEVVPGETYEYRSERFAVPYNVKEETVVTFAAEPQEGGTVSLKTSLGEQITSGGKCPLNTMLTIEALPAEGYALERVALGSKRIIPAEDMIVNHTTGTLSHTFTLTEETNSVTVFFVKKEQEQVALSCQATDGGKLIVRLVSDDSIIPNETKVNKGTLILLEAEAAEGYKFDRFTVDGAVAKPLYASERRATLKLKVEANMVIKAFFEKQLGNQHIESAEASVRVYLSATGEILYVDAEADAGPVQLFDLEGRCLYETEAREIPFASYPQGVYMVLVGNECYKVVK